MTSLLVETTNFPESSVEIFDSLKTSNFAFAWKTNDSTQTSYFPDQFVPHDFLQRFNQIYQKYIHSDSPILIDIPEDMRKKITSSFINHTNAFNKVPNKNDQISKLTPVKQMHGVWNPPPDDSLAVGSSNAATVSSTVLINAADRKNKSPVRNGGPKFNNEIDFGIGRDEEDLKLPETQKPLRISIFNEVKDYLLRMIFKDMFQRYLESNDGKRNIVEFQQQ
ncbi:hypothetical protein HK096_009326 [Nowakowskiella sp. JEL0078]|nr:hypothetical protein HK096_009326 [Nowakowskiella sp. JEL0078]